METRPLGQTGMLVTPIGFGAFKIGRNEKVKYPQSYDLPDEQTAARLLNQVLDLGVNLIDTAPAYGLSEERIGRALKHRRQEFLLSTKTGETFEQGESAYDYSAEGTRHSIHRSLERLQTAELDLVFIHSDGRDLWIQEQTDVVATLLALKEQGLIRAVGFSGKEIAGVQRALDWADVVMVEYHAADPSHTDVMQAANEKGIGVVVKKGLASGHLPPQSAIQFVLQHPAVSSLVIGGLNPTHLETNCIFAQEALRNSTAS